MSAVRQLAKTILCACAGRQRLLARGPRSLEVKPKLALTFDDGPDPEHTPRLLDLLDKLRLRATFFVIGQKVESQPELVRRAAVAGHEIANHTYTHSEPRITSAAVFLDEIRRTDDLIANLTDRAATTVRPPKGELSWAKLRGLWQSQKTVALWNVDPKDFRMNSQDDMARWCDAYKPRDGDIILLHDNHPYALQAIEIFAAKGIFEQFESTTIALWVRPPEKKKHPRIESEKSPTNIAKVNELQIALTADENK